MQGVAASEKYKRSVTHRKRLAWKSAFDHVFGFGETLIRIFVVSYLLKILELTSLLRCLDHQGYSKRCVIIVPSQLLTPFKVVYVD
jgi:hypothetical protein